MAEEKPDEISAIEAAKKKIAAKQAKREALLAVEEAPVAEERRREARRVGPGEVVRSIEKMVLRLFPDLPKDLKRADMRMDATTFIGRSGVLALSITIMLALVIFLLASTFRFSTALAVLAMPFIYILVFLWVMQYPRLRVSSKERQLDRDILFAGRDMLIALRSGVPLFNAMANVSKNYGVASEEFAKVVERIQSGVPAEVALQEASDLNTSKPFRRIMLQIVTSLRSGADVGTALEIVLNQISQEQIIELKRYGQKLNPLTMFYMLFGIILPSLGIAVGIILTTFINIRIDFGILLMVGAFVGFVQYMFLVMIRSSRPYFEL